MTFALVIGAGPAGLMAAEELAKAGLTVVIADAMPSVGRKFLMAGKSGLNLTKNESLADFLAAYGNISAVMSQALTAFGPLQVIQWATALGQDVFTGSSGRVFPKAMKASPLLRAWLARLQDFGVTVHTRWRWSGWDNDAPVFDTPEGRMVLHPAVTVLAMGGASWARLGSDGAWSAEFDDTAPFRPANMGFVVDWSAYMQPHFGHPVKGVTLTAGNTVSRGEFVITKRGIEGGGVYAVSAAMRDGAPLTIDLLPDVSLQVIQDRLTKKRAKMSVSNFLKGGLKLSPVKAALYQEIIRNNEYRGFDILARSIKTLPIPIKEPFPIDDAISTTGGIRFAVLDDSLMLLDRPGTFCAGEMLDWEAPTGGYLITGCLATGRWAGQAAAAFACH